MALAVLATSGFAERLAACIAVWMMGMLRVCLASDTVSLEGGAPVWATALTISTSFVCTARAKERLDGFALASSRA